MANAYQANELAAQQQYPQGQHVIVSGTVDSVSVSLGTTVVNFRPCLLGASLRLRDDQAQAAASLSPGQAIRADCETGAYLVGITFNNCSVL